MKPTLNLHQLALAGQNAERRLARAHPEEYWVLFEEEQDKIRHALSIDPHGSWGRDVQRAAS